LVVILFMAIDGYFIDGYRWLLMDIILVATCAYSINDYWLLFY
jgi:hypothetical protein